MGFSADGPAALFATLPAKRAVAAIREAGVAAEQASTIVASELGRWFDDAVAAGADPQAGTPSAAQAATMFGRADYTGLWG